MLVRRRPWSTPGDDGWTSEPSASLALAGFLFLVFIGFTALTMGPLISLDAYFNLDQPPRAWVPVLHVLDRIGQRAVCLPVLAAALVACYRHTRSWRPVWLAGGAVFLLNLVVLILKVGLGRGQPETADPSFFIGGMAYPSGHTSNIVLVYGLAAWLLGRYAGAGPVVRSITWGAVVLLSATMVVTSLTLNWHWFADLVAGLLIGAVVLELTSAVDAVMPSTVLDRGPLEIGRWLFRRAPAPRRQRPARERPAPGPATEPTTGSTAGPTTRPTTSPGGPPKSQPLPPPVSPPVSQPVSAPVSQPVSASSPAAVAPTTAPPRPRQDAS